VGGPPEFVTPEAGVLVDPQDPDALPHALELAASKPTPNREAREAAAEHDVKRQAALIAAVLERAASP
jgi:glycosyltransferase involved in cell wall biosynthesis